MTDLNLFLSDLEKFITGASPFLLTGFACLIIGYLLKPLKQIPNGLIPAIVTICGTIIYPLLTSNVSTPTDIHLPLPRRVMIGLGDGFIAWMFHNAVLDKWLDPALASLGSRLSKIFGGANGGAKDGQPK